MLAEPDGPELQRNPADTLLPTIRYLESRIEDAYWPKCPPVNEVSPEYAEFIRAKIHKGQIGEFARLSSQFAKAVQTAADHRVTFKLRDIGQGVFERRLYLKSNRLEDIFEGVIRIGVAEEDQKSKREQINALIEAQIDTVNAIQAYQENKKVHADVIPNRHL